MSGIKRSYFRRLIYASPLLIIAGGITMVFDVEYGGAMIGAGVLGLIIGLVTILRSRSSNRAQSQGYSSNIQTAQTYQSTSTQPLYQPIQPQEQPSTSEPKSNFCTNCGGKIDDTMTSCAHCGFNI